MLSTWSFQSINSLVSMSSSFINQKAHSTLWKPPSLAAYLGSADLCLRSKNFKLCFKTLWHRISSWAGSNSKPYLFFQFMFLVLFLYVLENAYYMNFCMWIYTDMSMHMCIYSIYTYIHPYRPIYISMWSILFCIFYYYCSTSTQLREKY